MGKIVCKFGGTSLADAKKLQNVVKIIRSDSRRRFVIPSAPGKRNQDDIKITDLLYLCQELAEEKLSYYDPFGRIEARYLELVRELGLRLDMDGLLNALKRDIEQGASKDFVASRGEFLCGKILADLLGATFVDPADSIRFRSDGKLNEVSYDLLNKNLEGEGLFVIPGFYGLDSEGQIKTFSRGGSDITGAIVARAVEAEEYENWTDVSGMLMSDPKIVPDARLVSEITYREVRELSYMGASVFHDEAMFPVREKRIPIHIRNSNRPNEKGTIIMPDRKITNELLVGVAGKPNFSMLYIEKELMNQEKGFGRKVLEVVASHDVSYEHTPSGIDSMSVIIKDEELGGKGEVILEDIRRILQPSKVEMISGLALIATVGEGMSRRIGIAARLFTALADARINVRVIDQGASEINIIIGVDEEDYKNAVQAIYRAFIN